MHRKNDNDNHILTPDERAFYMRQSIEGTQTIIQECLARYQEDGNLEALRIAFDGYVQLCDMLKKVNELYSYSPDFDYAL